MSKNIRHLATIRTIDKISAASNADRLEVATIGGWNSIVPKGQYTPGQVVIYTEVDSLIPLEDERFSLPASIHNQARLIDGHPFFKVRTARIRGNLSQGMIFDPAPFGLEGETPGTDVTERLGVRKFEAPTSVNSTTVGPFPSQFAIKSDAERVQNLVDIYPTIRAHRWVATEKIDGTSITLINDGGVARVASRNWEVNPTGHAIWSVIKEDEFLAGVPKGHAVQGELFGERIQGNPLGLRDKQFKVFTEFDHGHPLPLDKWSQWATDRQVPTVNITLPDTVDELINLVDGMESALSDNHLAEGVVFHEAEGVVIPEVGRPTFKVISNEYLLGGRD